MFHRPLLYLIFFTTSMNLFAADEGKDQYCEKEFLKCAKNFESIDAIAKDSDLILFCNEMTYQTTIFREHLEEDKKLQVKTRGDKGWFSDKAVNRPSIVVRHKNDLIKFDVDYNEDSGNDCPPLSHIYKNVFGNYFIAPKQQGWGDAEKNIYTLFLYKLEHEKNKYIIASNNLKDSKSELSKINNKTTAMMWATQTTLSCDKKKASDYVEAKSKIVSNIKKNCLKNLK